MRRVVLILLVSGLGALTRCSQLASSPITPIVEATVATSQVERFCDLPGSVRSDGTVVPGASGLPDLSWMKVPEGFCVHFFAAVGNARAIRFAPGGELFVASPVRGTMGGGPNGRAAVVVLPDDDRDGLADSTAPFISGLAAVQGMLFANGSFYFQDDTLIRKMPYARGDREARPYSAAIVADLSTRWQSGEHWPKTLDRGRDGTIYVSNGSDQGEPCDDRPFRGGILAIDGNNPMDGTPIAKGFRNPMYLRCEYDHDHCFVTECGRAYSWGLGGRSKLAEFRSGDDFGYPCCATKDLPFPDSSSTDCSKVRTESVPFSITSVPFGFDFEPGGWPAPWKRRVFVAFHGEFGIWVGARIVAIDLDSDGVPLPGGTLSIDGGDRSNASTADFASGWDDGKLDHGRPADITFASDGRMFVAQDNGPLALDREGIVFWVAPIDLRRP